MNPKVLETWISEILMQAEAIGIPSIYWKSDKKSAISQYKADKKTL